MSFSRANPLGWALFEELTSAQMNVIDLNQSRAIDGVDGGVYNLGSPLTINGVVNIDGLNTIGDATGDELTLNVLNVNVTTTLLGATTMSGFLTHLNSTTTNFNTVANFQTGEVFFDAGVFVNVSAITTFTSSSDTTFEGPVDFQGSSGGSPVNFLGTGVTFSNGFTASGVPAVFNSRPSMGDGITFGSTDKVYYPGGAGFTVGMPFTGAPGPINAGRWLFGIGFGFYYQVDETWPSDNFRMIDGFMNNEPVNILTIEVYVRGENLSGTPAGDTEFILFTQETNGTPAQSRQVLDSAPNNASAHIASWSSTPLNDPVPFEPATQSMGIYFRGYRGGDVLNGTTKWYEVRHMRFAFQTFAKGIY